MQRCEILLISWALLMSCISCVEHAHEQPSPAAPVTTVTEVPGLVNSNVVSASAAEASAINDLPVRVTACVTHSAEASDSALQLIIKMHIGRGWRVHAADSSGPFVPFSVKIENAQGAHLCGDIRYPASNVRLAHGVEERVHDENVEIQVNFENDNPGIAEGQTIRCRVEYQACNQFRCLPSETRVIEIALSNGAVAEGQNVSQEN